MVLFLRLALLAVVVAVVAWPQLQEQKQEPRDEMFSGTITAIGENSVTANRSGTQDSKTFLLTPETRIEGPKPEVNFRVTIRYIATEQGEVALRIIVRSPTKK